MDYRPIAQRLLEDQRSGHAQSSPSGNLSATRTSAGAGRVRGRPVSWLVAVLAALALAVVVAGCSLFPAPALTDDEWAWCQGHWLSGLDPSQRNEPSGSTWYFNHMGYRNDADTIRVCRAAAMPR